MSAPRIADLVRVIREALPSMPVKVPGRGLGMGWTRPPLISDRVLRGVPLNRYASVASDLPFSELRGLYEEFIGTFMFPEEGEAIATNGAQDFLTVRLGLHKRVADWLFPAVNLPAWHHLAVLLWIISNSEPDADFRAEGNTIVVSHGNVNIGVDNGEVLSRFVSGKVPEDVDFFVELNTHHMAAKPRVSERSALNLFYRQTFLITDMEERDAVQEALQYLFYRYDHLGRLTDYLYEGTKMRSANGINRRASARKCVDYLMRVPNPMPTIFRIMTGATSGMSSDEFEELLPEGLQYSKKSEDEMVPGELLMEWHRALMKVGRINNEQ